jgi:hypothetical protein
MTVVMIIQLLELEQVLVRRAECIQLVVFTHITEKGDAHAFRTLLKASKPIGRFREVTESEIMLASRSYSARRESLLVLNPLPPNTVDVINSSIGMLGLHRAWSVMLLLESLDLL